MNRQDLLDLLMAWENLDLIAREMKAQPQHLEPLFDIALNSKYPGNWRAAYIADKVNSTAPELISPYIETIISTLSAETHSSLKRHLLKLISLHPLPEKHHSFMLDFCLDCFTSAAEPVAVRVHAMQVLYNISEYEPGFKPELLEIITHESALQTSPGIRSRGRKLTIQLRKQIRKSGSCLI